jgi:hypothetical protein
LLIVCLLFWAIYDQVFQNKNLSQIGEQVSALTSSYNILLLLLVSVLVFVNWGIEAHKWQQLINQSYNISFFTSFKAVLGGITIASATPNRVGEHICRVFFVDDISKGKSISLTFVGICSQILITAIVGVVGLSYYLFYFTSLQAAWYGVVVGGSLVTAGSLTWLYFYINALPQWIYSIKVFKKWQRYIDTIKQFTRVTLNYLLWLSFSRYVVFSVQFLLLLLVFGVTLPLIEGFLMIGLIFFVQMALPYPALAELGVRGNVALFFLGKLTEGQEIGIISATFSLWMVNILLPTLIGSYFVLKQKFF